MSNYSDEKFVTSFNAPTRGVADSLVGSSGVYDFGSSSTLPFEATAYAVNETVSFEPVTRAFKIMDEPVAPLPAPSTSSYQYSKFMDQSRLGGLDSLSTKPQYVEETIEPDVVVPPMPIFFGRSTSFTSSAPASQLWRSLRTTLARNPDVVSRPEQTSLQIHGELARAGMAFRFCVNLSQYTEETLRLVEVALLCGDRFEFNAFFHDLCDDLGNLVSTRFSKRLPCPPLALQPSKADLPIPQLASMAQSLDDVAREGLQALAQLSIETPLPLTHDVQAALCAGSKSHDWHANRSTAVVMANMSGHESVRGAMASEEMLQCMHSLMQANQDSHAVDTQRNICTTLMNLSQTESSRLSGSASLRKILSEQPCPDQFVQSALAAVRKVTVSF